MAEYTRPNVRKFLPVTTKQLLRHRMIDNTVIVDGMEVTHAVVVGMFIAGDATDTSYTCSIDDSTGVLHNIPYHHNEAFAAAQDKYVRAVITFQPNAHDPSRAMFSIFSCVPLADDNEIYHHLLLAYQTAATFKNPQLFPSSTPAPSNFTSTNTAYNPTAPVATGSNSEFDSIPLNYQRSIKDAAGDNTRLIPILSSVYHLQLNNNGLFTKEDLYNRLPQGVTESRPAFEQLFNRLLDEGVFYSTNDTHYATTSF